MTYNAGLNVVAGVVSADLTNFVVRLDLADLPAGWWDEYDLGGRNVRPHQGGTSLPFDLVKFDAVTRTGVMYIRVPTIYTATNNVVTIAMENGATLPAATDTYGRNACWAGYTAVFDFTNNENLDRTGGGKTLTLQGGALIQNGRLELVNNYADLSLSLSSTWSARVAWYMTNAAQRAIFRVTGSGYGRYLIDDGNRVGLYNGSWGYPSDASVAANNWYSTHATCNGTNQRIYGRYGSTSATKGSSTLTTLQLGYSDSDNEFYGYMQRVAVHPSTRSDAWVRAEHLSWEDRANFYAITADPSTAQTYTSDGAFTSTFTATPGYWRVPEGSVTYHPKVSLTATADRRQTIDLSNMPPGWWSRVSATGHNIRVRTSAGVTVASYLGAFNFAAKTGTLYFYTATAGAQDFYIDLTDAVAGVAYDDPLGRNAIQGKTAVTNAYVVHQDPTHEVIVGGTPGNLSGAFISAWAGGAGAYPSTSDGPVTAATQVTVPAANVTAALSGFVVKVDLSDMGETWWALASLDGGNVRALASMAGTPAFGGNQFVNPYNTGQVVGEDPSGSWDEFTASWGNVDPLPGTKPSGFPAGVTTGVGFGAPNSGFVASSFAIPINVGYEETVKVGVWVYVSDARLDHAQTGIRVMQSNATGGGSWVDPSIYQEYFPVTNADGWTYIETEFTTSTAAADSDGDMTYVTFEASAARNSADTDYLPMFLTGASVQTLGAPTPTEYLPCDVVKFDHDGQVGELFFKADLSNVVDNEFYIATVDGGVVPHVEDSARGRKAVWSDYLAVFIDGDVLNRATTSQTMSLTGSSGGSANYLNATRVSVALNHHQGVEWNPANGHFYCFDSDQITHYDQNWNLVQDRNGGVNSEVTTYTGALKAINHTGDGCIARGELYTTPEKYTNSPYDNQFIAVYDLDTLALKRVYDIRYQANGTYGHEISSISFNPADGFFYITDYTDTAGGIHKYDLVADSETVVYQGEIILETGLGSKQGIAIMDGYMYLSGSGVLWRYNLDGTNKTLMSNQDFGTIEGISPGPSGSIYMLFDNPSYVYQYTPNALTPVVLDSFDFRSQWGKVVTSEFVTDFVMGTSQTPTAGGRAAIVSHGQNSTSDARSTLLIEAGVLQMWNDANGWHSSGVAIPLNERHRVHYVENGGTRTAYKNGAQAGAADGTTQGTGNTFFIAAEDTTAGERFVGYQDYIYLRRGALSAAWLAAEQASWENTPTFYSVTTDLGESQVVTLGAATETDVAQSLAISSSSLTVTLGVATETDVAQPLAEFGALIQFPLGVATETDVAGTLTYTQVRVLGAATETDSAQPFAQLFGAETGNMVGGRSRGAIGTARWTPPVTPPPEGTLPPIVEEVAHAFSDVTMNGTMPIYNVEAQTKKKPRERILVGGKDVTFFRDVPTPFPGYGLIEPLMYAPTMISFPQIAAVFENPGEGDLYWCRPWAPVEFQRVDPDTNEVLAVDYRGLIVGYDIEGSSLVLQIGGEVTGRAAMRERQVPIFFNRLDLGRMAYNGIRRLGVPFEPYLGPDTGIQVQTFGGTSELDHLQQIVAMSYKNSGERWTIMPKEDDPKVWEMRLKDRETVHGTVYCDDERTVATLSRDMTEEPNRIFMTGVQPNGQRVRFGQYPGLKQSPVPPYPFNDKRTFGEGTTDAMTDTGDSISIMIARLRITKYMNADEAPGGYDADVTKAIKELQKDAGLTRTGDVNVKTWNAMYDFSATGYSLRWSGIQPAAEDTRVQPWFKSGSGARMRRNPNYKRHIPKVDRNVDVGSGFWRKDMINWARAEITEANTPNYVGTIVFNLGGLISGLHTPGDPFPPERFMSARDLKPGMNLWLPQVCGGILVHISAVTISPEGVVSVDVDTRGRDAMEVWQVIDRNRESRKSPYRAWMRDHRQSAESKDANGVWDEVGGVLGARVPVPANTWVVFPIVAGQEGTIRSLRLNTNPNAEYVVAVFGKRIRPSKLRRMIGNPLTKVGSEKWEDETKQEKLDRQNVLLYIAGTDKNPLGFWPKKKSKGGTRTGKWKDDAGFPYHTGSHFGEDKSRQPIIWVAVFADRQTVFPDGRIMWNTIESGA